ncbi:phenolic glucoside malonyltransferase 1-like isoform X1 [Momordica charantia]|uniref:Phenolic glucoside malonyltransferase 1-like isoform X1 n=1 Tax=Momordica charantia TaxID=3673 RepID=A0A6J1BX96_MOMCH|nr:phenolic glucoside malonyltransferase 1-like isoform X1 [Momordica charantia]
MEEGKLVRIVEVCKICPSKHSSSESQFSLPLASFDWISLRVPLLQRLLFYPQTQTHDYSFTDSIVPTLKRSLSLTLTHFLPLAGNVVWPEDSALPFFLYSPNDGVSFTVADTTHADFHHVSGGHPRQIHDCLPFIPTIQSSDSSTPILAIQLTHFPNHGFSIGFAAHHVIFDGRSFTLFVKAWAYISKLIANQLDLDLEFCPLPPELTPSFERPPNVLRNPFDYVPKNRSVKCNTEYLPTSNYLMATFQLTPTHIQKLKKRVLEEVEKEEAEELHLSTFVVAYAYALICFIKSKGGECKELLNFEFAVDVRGVLDPPVSSTYFGNCLSNPAALMEAREVREEGGLSKIAKKISHMIVELRRTRTVKVSTMADCIQFQTKYFSTAELCWVASSPKFKLYQTNFGWGNPNKVEMVLLGKNMMYLIDTKDGSGGGVEIGLLFPNRHQWEIFASLFAEGIN